MIGNAAAIGFTPQELYKMSIWQFSAAVRGYILSKNPQDPTKFQEDQKDDILDWLNTFGDDAEKIVNNFVYSWDGIELKVIRKVEFSIKEKQQTMVVDDTPFYNDATEKDFKNDFR